MAIKHLWFFQLGNPAGGQFTSSGHFTLNTQTNTVTGLLQLVASDNSWIAHGIIESFEFDNDDNTVAFEIGFTAILGTIPFPLPPETVPFEFPVGIAFESSTVPNLFAFIGDPAPVPPAV